MATPLLATSLAADELPGVPKTSLHHGRVAALHAMEDQGAEKVLSGQILDFEYDDPGHFYTADYPYLFFHNMAGFGIYPNSPELLAFMSRFDTIWAGNVFPLPPSFVDHLHTAGGKKRTLIFYEFFLAVHFIFGRNNPQAYEAWQVDFLEDHKTDFYTINPLIPPDYTQFSPGRYSPGLGWLDYFVNYGRTGGGPEAFLANQFYDVKRADWGYDGVFFDLSGGYFMQGSQIQDPNDSSQTIVAMAQYNMLSGTRSDPSASYDDYGSAFLETLRAKNPDTAAFPIWGNQTFRSGNATTGENPYYEFLQADLDESTFTTWYNPGGWTTGVRVYLDGQWYENANPIETRIVPFQQGVNTLQPLIQQTDYAKANYGNDVNGVILNYLRPAYRPFEDGYEAVVDREAIFYGYATGMVTGLPSFNWDFFDTFVTIPGVPGAPASTGLPTQGYYRWAFDPIYFLDLGEKITPGYETITGLLGRRAAFSEFEKGFVVVNSSSPARNFTVNLSGKLPGEEDGVFGYYDHFTGEILPSTTTSFLIPSPYYPIGNLNTNSGRVYSFVNEDGNLVGTEVSRIPDAFTIH